MTRIRVFRLMAGVATLLLIASSSPAGATPIVRTETGLVAGVTAKGVEIYLGLPYAAPPTGELRWRPPQPAHPWLGTRPAKDFQSACMQAGVSMPGEAPPKIAEDCLYLNVWTPLRPKTRNGAPVIVWIHGGGYANGSAAMPLYEGDRLARKGVVVVNFGYRLGPLGFMAHPELSRESGHASSGNYGLMDQIAALQWVQRNIAAFGGDPTKVTIAGQSAGSMSVSLLMASPKAAGLFRSAIGQSGGVFEPLQLAPSYQLAQAEKDGVIYAASLSAPSLSALRALPASRLLEGRAGLVTHPVIEPYILPYSPYDAYISGRQNKAAILIGYNADEAQSLTDLKSVRAATFVADLTHAWGPLPPPIVEAYPFTDDPSARRARADLERDLRFRWDMWAWARLQARDSERRVYLYRFNENPPFPSNSPRAGWGASHFAELWYMFDHLGQERWAWRDDDRRLASMMARYWVNFASTGDPNGPGLPVWPAFGPGAALVMNLDAHPMATEIPDLEPLRVFDSVYDAVRGSSFGLATKPSPAAPPSSPN